MNRTAIICVDDEQIILQSLGEQLKRSLGKDYDIELACSAEEALFLCNELEAGGISVALIISDQRMPFMSGDELLIKIHATYPQTLKILLTGQADVDSVGNIVNANALYRYISKPWDETDLILTVKEALRRYEQESELAKQNTILKQKNKLLKRSSRKISKAFKLMLAIFENRDDGILVIDRQGDIAIFNQKFSLLWNIDADLVRGNISHVAGLIARRVEQPGSIDFLLDRDNLESGKNHLLKLNDGTILESNFQPLKLKEQIVGKIWEFRDVTVK